MKVKLIDGTEVELKPLLVKDVKSAGKLDDVQDQSIFLVSKSTGIDIEKLEELDVRDFHTLEDGVSTFLPQVRQ